MENFCYHEIPKNKKFKDITGKQFGKLIVVGYAGKNDKIHYWICKCSCGGPLIKIRRYNLISGHTRSCGCLVREIFHPSIHGMTKTPEYCCWRTMRDRCLNPKCKFYIDYGGRGIKICDRWLESFENFYEDMGPRPSNKHSIDRIDNNGNYCKENCKWSTTIEQCNNRRTNRMIEFNNEIKTLVEWSRITEIPPRTIAYRILAGWTIEESLTTKVRARICE